MDAMEAGGGKALRRARLCRHDDGRFLFVPLDHSVSDGPIADTRGFRRIVQQVVAGGADGVVLHKGRVRAVPPAVLAGTGLIVHLSASTRHAADKDAKVLVGDVEQAIRLGADAVSVHVNVGSASESRQLADLGTVAGACDTWGVPLLAMMYPRGPRIADPHDPTLLSHVANIAADLGADLVKVPLASSPEGMAEVVASSPLPLVVAGGPSTAGRDTLDLARAALGAGCAGLAVGRQVFGSADPEATVHTLARLVHASSCPSESGVRSLAPVSLLSGVR